MKTNMLLLTAVLLLAACSKTNDAPSGSNTLHDIVTTSGIAEKTETANDITFRSFIKQGQTQFKGILIMGSGNNEDAPTPGALDGAAETHLCEKAAENGYAAAIVQYRQTPGTSKWNESAQMVGEDFDKCIVAISSKYGVDKTRAVVGGVSYASYMLLTDIALNSTLSYAKGVLAACGSADSWKAQNFKIPVFSISCSGNNEGDLTGKDLYDAIPDSSPIKALSGGVTDNSCDTHCGGDWTTNLYAQLTLWLP